MQTLTVNLGDRSYPIHVGEGILPRAGEFLSQAGLRGKVAIVTNPTVAQLYLDAVHEALTDAGFEMIPILIPEGEEHKNLKTLASIYDRLITERLERNSCIMALGGGVVGDVAGFIAATYLHGIPLVQVDSSVGGKTGVNHQNGKNLIGAFHQLRSVLIDVIVFQSLPPRELVAGLAEVIKYGVIEHPALFTLLEEKIDKVIGLDRELLVQIIATSCRIKARVVEKDEREDDYRAVLNFGHTIGHALEAVTDYRKYLHGEAVGIGMAQATAISVHQGFCDQRSLERIRKLIRKAGLPADIPPDVSRQSLIQSMEVDKKSAEGRIKFVMCAGIGRTCFHSLAFGEILAALGA
ncbi:MAG: 3-dehydroquinate synthase [Deltaproteobacteria bacterium 13_1_40CM_4_54_4]|nr:MAG: 3-dehydroquinate synthase [Deltaproteobacteria bacterium 13_1_40CM_4_54_4]